MFEKKDNLSGESQNNPNQTSNLFATFGNKNISQNKPDLFNNPASLFTNKINQEKKNTPIQTISSNQIKTGFFLNEPKNQGKSSQIDVSNQNKPTFNLFKNSQVNKPTLLFGNDEGNKNIFQNAVTNNPSTSGLNENKNNQKKSSQLTNTSLFSNKNQIKTQKQQPNNLFKNENLKKANPLLTNDNQKKPNFLFSNDNQKKPNSLFTNVNQKKPSQFTNDNQKKTNILKSENEKNPNTLFSFNDNEKKPATPFTTDNQKKNNAPFTSNNQKKNNVIFPNENNQLFPNNKQKTSDNQKINQLTKSSESDKTKASLFFGQKQKKKDQKVGKAEEAKEKESEVKKQKDRFLFEIKGPDKSSMKQYDKKIYPYLRNSINISNGLYEQKQLQFIVSCPQIKKKIQQGLVFPPYNQQSCKRIEQKKDLMFGLSNEALRNLSIHNIKEQIKFYIGQLIKTMSKYLNVDAEIARNMIDQFMIHYNYMDNLVIDNKLNIKYFEQKQVIVTQNNKPILNEEGTQIIKVKKKVLEMFLNQQNYYLYLLQNLVYLSIENENENIVRYFKNLLNSKLNKKLWQTYLHISNKKIPELFGPIEQQQWIQNAYQIEQRLLKLLYTIHSNYSKQCRLKQESKFLINIFQTFDKQNFRGSFKVHHRQSQKLKNLPTLSQNLILATMQLQVILVQPNQLASFYTPDLIKCINKLSASYTQPFKAILPIICQKLERKYQSPNIELLSLFNTIDGSAWSSWLDLWVIFGRGFIENSFLIGKIAEILIQIIKENGKSYWKVYPSFQTVNIVFEQLIQTNAYMTLKIGCAMLSNHNDIQEVIEYFSQIRQHQKIDKSPTNLINKYIYNPLVQKIKMFVTNQNKHNRFSYHEISIQEQEKIDELIVQVKFLCKAIYNEPEVIEILESKMLFENDSYYKNFGGRYLIFFVVDLIYFFQYRYQEINYRILTYLFRAINSLLRSEKSRKTTYLILSIYQYLFPNSINNPLLLIVEEFKRTQNIYEKQRSKLYEVLLDHLLILINYPCIYQLLPDENQFRRKNINRDLIEKMPNFIYRYQQQGFVKVLQKWESLGCSASSNWFSQFLSLLELPSTNAKFLKLLQFLLQKLSRKSLHPFISQHKQENGYLKIITKTLNLMNIEQMLPRVFSVIINEHEGELLLDSKQWKANREDKWQKLLYGLLAFQQIVELVNIHITLLSQNNTNNDHFFYLNQLNCVNFFQRYLTSKHDLYTYDIQRMQKQKQYIATIKANIVLVLSSYINFQKRKQFRLYTNNYTRPIGFTLYVDRREDIENQMAFSQRYTDHHLYFNYLAKPTSKNHKFHNSISAMALRCLTKLVNLWDHPKISKKPLINQLLSLQRNDKNQISLFYSNHKGKLLIRNAILNVLDNWSQQEIQVIAALDFLIACFANQKQFLSVFMKPNISLSNKIEKDHTITLQKIIYKMFTKPCNSEITFRMLGFLELVFLNEDYFQDFVLRLRNNQILFMCASELLKNQIKPSRTVFRQIPYLLSEPDPMSTTLQMKLTSYFILSYNQMILFQMIRSLLSMILSEFVKNVQNLKLITIIRSIFQKLYNGHWTSVFFKDYKDIDLFLQESFNQINKKIKKYTEDSYQQFHNQVYLNHQPRQYKSSTIQLNFQNPFILLKEMQNCNYHGLGKDYIFDSNQLFYQLLLSGYQFYFIHYIVMEFQVVSTKYSLMRVKEAALNSWTQLFIFIGSLGNEGYMMTTCQLNKDYNLKSLTQNCPSGLSLISPNPQKIPYGFSSIFANNEQQSQHFIINFIHDILDNIESNQIGKSMNVPLSLLGTSLACLNASKRLSNDVKRMLIKMTVNKKWLMDFNQPLTLYSIIQFLSLALTFQVKHDFKTLLIKKLYQNINTKKLILCAYIIIQKEINHREESQVIMWVINQLKKLNTSQTCDQQIYILCKMIMNMTKKSSKQLKDNNLPTVFANLSIFKNIEEISSYVDTRNRNNDHLIWLWTIAVLRQYQMQSNIQQFFDQSVGSFVERFFSRICKVLQSSRVFEQKTMKPSLNLAVIINNQHLEQISLLMQFLWHFFQRAHLYTTSYSNQLNVLVEIITKYTLTIYSPNINLLQIFKPYTSTERIFESIMSGNKKSQNHMIYTTTPMFSPYKSPSSRNFQNYGIQYYQPNLFIFRVEMIQMSMCIPALGCISNIINNIKIESNQTFIDLARNISDIQRYLIQNMSKWFFSQAIVNNLLAKLNVYSQTVQNSIATGLLCSIIKHPKNINQLGVQCSVSLILAFEAAFVQMSAWKQAQRYWGVVSNEQFGEFRNKQMSLISQVERLISSWQNSAFEILCIGNRSSYWKRLMQQFDNLK